jgi:hypothetical protein
MPPHHIRLYLVVRSTKEGAMSEPHAATDDPQKPGWYEIRLQGRLEARWAAWFDGLSLSHESDGTTVIRGPVGDQAALHGLLTKVRDLGLPLIAVTQVDPTSETETNA